jgi:hypothetical protein
MELSMKQKAKFISIAAGEKLLYLGQVRESLAYHFNMINSIFNIYVAGLFKTE